MSMSITYNALCHHCDSDAEQRGGGERGKRDVVERSNYSTNRNLMLWYSLGGGTDAQGDFRPVGWYQDEKTPLSHLEHQVIVVTGVLNTRFTQLFTKTATLSPTLCQF